MGWLARLFGWQDTSSHRVATQITKMVRDDIRLAEMRGLPSGFWRSPFVVGYCVGQTKQIYQFLNIKSNDPDHSALVSLLTLSMLSGETVDVMSDVVARSADFSDADFYDGDAAGKLVAATKLGGIDPNEGHPALLSARLAAMSMPGGETPSMVAAILVRRVWLDQIPHRVGSTMR